MILTRPIEPFQLTQEFGVNPAAYARFGLKGHNGWDLRTKWNDTPNGIRDILASWTMQFYKQADEGNDGYGKYFETICHINNRYKLTFGHCSKLPENFGTKHEGEVMNKSGNTGNSTGPHLHLTVKEIDENNNVLNYNNGFFGAINPQIFFDDLRSFKSKPQPPMNTDKRLYWFDVMNKPIWNKPHESLVDNDIHSFAQRYPSERERGGKWDQLCLKAGLQGDSNEVSVDFLFRTIQEKAPTKDESAIRADERTKTLNEIKSLITTIK